MRIELEKKEKKGVGIFTWDIDTMLPFDCLFVLVQGRRERENDNIFLLALHVVGELSNSRSIDSTRSFPSLLLPMFLLLSPPHTRTSANITFLRFSLCTRRERVRHASIVALPQFSPSQMNTCLSTLLKSYLFVITLPTFSFFSSSSHAFYHFFC